MAKIKHKDDQQFAYWLQGYFEIAGTEKLTDAQLLKIAGAAAKVEQKGPLTRFVLDNIAVNAAGHKIAKFLNDTFIHDIDQTYEGDQDEFNDIHNAGQQSSRPRPRTPGPRRC